MLTATQVRRHAPFSPPMIKGHMDQTRCNQHSTKSASPTVDTNASEDFTPTLSPDDTTCSNHVFAAFHEITGKIATDQTGNVKSLSSNEVQIRS